MYQSKRRKADHHRQKIRQALEEDQASTGLVRRCDSGDLAKYCHADETPTYDTRAVLPKSRFSFNLTTMSSFFIALVGTIATLPKK